MTVQCVILAGGRGTRISEESHLRPKPMIEIGGQPILWHIMKSYGHYGVTDFVICLGYRGYMIKEYFFNYFLHSSDVTVDIATNTADLPQQPQRALAGDPGRHRRVAPSPAAGSCGSATTSTPTSPSSSPTATAWPTSTSTPQLDFHRGPRPAGHDDRRPPAGPLRRAPLFDDDRVVAFEEKPQAAAGVINGGFFVLSPGGTRPHRRRRHPMGDHAAPSGWWPWTRCAAWRHDGFWQPMDTLREKELLEALWDSGSAALEGLGMTSSWAGTAGARHRSHRLQGRLAHAVARTAGRHGESGWPCRPRTPPARLLRSARGPAWTSQMVDLRDGPAVADAVRRARPRGDPAPGRPGAGPP